MATPSILDLARQNQDVRAFLSLSAALGRDPLLIQASGGNTSIKDGGLLWVKASGKCLAAAVEQEIMVPVDLPAVRAAVGRGDADPVSAHVAAATSLRPSIETTLHALLPHRVVVHVHSVNALAWTTLADGRERVAGRLAGLNWAWVPYRRPGLPLTLAVREAAQAAPDILVLGNHGLVVGGSCADDTESRLREAEARLTVPGRPLPPAEPSTLAALAPGGYRLPLDPAIHGLATDPHVLAAARAGALYPDHVVFLGGEAPVASSRRPPAAAVSSYRDRYGAPPPYILVEGVGVLVADPAPFGVEEMLLCQAEVLSRVGPGAALRYLADDEVAELLNWDAETYRRTLSH